MAEAEAVDLHGQLEHPVELDARILWAQICQLPVQALQQATQTILVFLQNHFTVN